MRNLNNNHGVANVVSYLFSFTIATMIMLSSIYLTNSIINEKTKEVAELEAQNIANYVANAISEAAAARQSMPDAEYKKTLNLPSAIAGKSYNIEVTNNAVYVTTSDGSVRKDCNIPTGNGVDTGIASSKIFSSKSKITVSYNKSDFTYKFDFGTGNSLSHSPVEAGYFNVKSPVSVTSEDIWDPNYDDYLFRVPIKISNPSLDFLSDIPIKIVLNSSNFNYDYASVTPYQTTSSGVTQNNEEIDITTATSMNSNLLFYDTKAAITIPVSSYFTPSNIFYWHQKYNSTKSDLNGNNRDIASLIVKVDSIENNLPNSSYVLFDEFHPLTISGPMGEPVTCIDWTPNYNGPSLGRARFYISDIFSLLPDDLTDGSKPRLEINGYFKDMSKFTTALVLSIKYGDVYVDGDYTGSSYGTKEQPYKTIQDGINNADEGKTIYISGSSTKYNEQITIDKNINLVGEYSEGQFKTIINGYGFSNFVIRVTYQATESNICCLRIEEGDPGYYPEFTRCDGILLDGCSDVIVAKCQITENQGDGIQIKNGAKENIIKDCEIFDNVGTEGSTGYLEHGNGINIYGSQTNKNLIINSDIYTHNSDFSNGIIIHNGANNNVVDNCEIYGSQNGKHINGIQICSLNNDFAAGGSPANYNKIKNCTIRDYGTGVDDDEDANGILIGGDDETYPSKYNIIDGCEIYNIYGSGVCLSQSKYTTVKNCNKVSENCVGIWIFKSEYNTVKDCNIYTNENNEWVSYLSPLWKTQGDGIHIDKSSSHNTVSNCKIYSNDGNGINIANKIVDSSTEASIVEYCDIYDNGEDSTKAGIRLFLISDTTIRFCNIYENNFDGMYISGKNGIFPIENNIEFCNFFRNGDDGIHMDFFASKNNITRNNFYCNGQITNLGVGIYIGFTPLANDIYGNNFINNHGTWEFVEDLYFTPDSADDSYHTLPANSNYWDNTRIEDPSTMGNYWCHLNEIVQGLKPYGTEDFYNIPKSARPNDANKNDEYPRGLPWEGERGKLFLNPNVIHVYPSGTPDLDPPYSTDNIQTAIDNVIDGGSIIIHSGAQYTLDQTININKSLRMIGVVGNSKPKIVYNGVENQAVIKISKMSTGAPSEGLPPGFDRTVYIDNIEIDGGNKADQGISVDITLVPAGETELVNISRCKINNCQNGVHSKNSLIDITECNINDNTNSGVWIDGVANNIITDSNFVNNYMGIFFGQNSKNNLIQDCIFSSNTYSGIRLLNSGSANNPNTIKYCYIDGNSQSTDYGILMDGISKFNIINYCKFKSSDYGIWIASAATNNKIYFNEFLNSGTDRINAHSDGSNNFWDDGTKGNYWKDYEGKDTDFNGVGETPYNISGPYNEKDNYPVGSDRFVESELKNSIEYWNPYGESVILLKMDIPANDEKLIYLYYGSKNSNASKMSNFNDTSVFFKKYSGADAIIEKGQKKMINDYYISIPNPGEPGDPGHTKSEAMYILEARLKLPGDFEKNQANMLLLSDSNGAIGYISTIYMNSSDQDNPNNFYIHKLIPSGEEFGKEITGETLLNGPVALPKSLDHWIYMKSFIYVSKNIFRIGDEKKYTNYADISSYVYDYISMSEEGSISDRDVGTPYPNPYLGGYLGVGCGLLNSFYTSDDANITVDWLRLRKIPMENPDVTIGSTEFKDAQWSDLNISSVDSSPSGDPYKPGPVLRDYHKSSETVIFSIEGLNKGEYTIIITKGDYLSPRGNMTVDISDGSNYYGTLNFAETEAGGFETKTIQINKLEDGSIYLNFKPESGGEWTVNSIIIEKGQRGIKIS